MAATDTVNDLRQRLKQKRSLLLDTDGSVFFIFLVFLCFFIHILWLNLRRFCVIRSVSFCDEFTVAGYARSQGKNPVSFGPTDLVCCRTLQGHTGKVRFHLFIFLFYLMDFN